CPPSWMTCMSSGLLLLIFLATTSPSDGEGTFALGFSRARVSESSFPSECQTLAHLRFDDLLDDDDDDDGDEISTQRRPEQSKGPALRGKVFLRGVARAKDDRPFQLANRHLYYQFCRLLI